MTDSELYSILIDTNAMISLSLFIDCCNNLPCELGVDMEHLLHDYEERREILREYLEIKEIRKGWILFNYLMLQYEKYDNLYIYFSLLNEFEIKKIFLETVYHREMTRKSIPYRIRKQKPFRIQFDFNYETDVEQYWEQIKSKLEDNNIEIIYPDKDEQILRDTIEKVSRIVSSNIALDSQDLYLYSLGIVIRANEIYSFDSDFLNIINKINTESKCRSKRESIVRSLIAVLSDFSEEYTLNGKIDLPIGRKLTFDDITRLKEEISRSAS